MKFKFTIFILVLFFRAWSDGDALQKNDLKELVEKSELIFTGWPSLRKQTSPCGEPYSLWQINYIIKGDEIYRHQVISIHNHEVLKTSNTGSPRKGQRPTIMLLKKSGDCWDLTSENSQRELSEEQLIRSLVNPTDCRAQKEAVRVTLNKLPQGCIEDSDCRGMNLNPNSCERPRPYNINAVKMLPTDWNLLANRARVACGPEWSNQSACSPWPTEAYCKGERCVLGTKIPEAPAFREVTMTESCAPHDAGSIVLEFNTGVENSFPHFSVNWWGSTQPTRSAGTYTLSNGFSGKTGEGFSSSYCKNKGNCAIITKIYLKVLVNENGTGEAELEGVGFDGSPIKMKAPLRILPAIKNLRCG